MSIPKTTFYINPGNREYPGNYPPFYDTTVCREMVRLMEENTQVFVDEWENYVHQQSARKSKLFFLYKETGWQTIMLYSYGMRYHGNCKQFPKTLSRLANVKGMVTVYFSTLQPGTRLTPHWGDTDATYRIHLGLDVPGGLPDCGIEVGGIQQAWERGKTFVFNDAHFHTAWNMTDKPRTVLIVDILKPELYGKRWYIIPAILGAMGMGRVLYPLGILKKMPGWLTNFLHLGATIIFMGILPVQRAFRVFFR